MTPIEQKPVPRQERQQHVQSSTGATLSSVRQKPPNRKMQENVAHTYPELKVDTRDRNGHHISCNLYVQRRHGSGGWEHRA